MSQTEYDELQTEYDELQTEYDEILTDLNGLQILEEYYA